MKFEKWLEKEGIELNLWQMKFAQEALNAMYPYRCGASGKTFIMETLSRFVGEHGNDFE